MLALGPAEVPALSQSAGAVRVRPGLSFPAATTVACRIDAGWLAALDQHAGYQCSDRVDCRGADLAHRRESLLRRASADHAAGGHLWRLAVLRAAPVRGHLLG